MSQFIKDQGISLSIKLLEETNNELENSEPVHAL